MFYPLLTNSFRHYLVFTFLHCVSSFRFGSVSSLWLSLVLCFGHHSLIWRTDEKKNWGGAETEQEIHRLFYVVATCFYHLYSLQHRYQFLLPLRLFIYIWEISLSLSLYQVITSSDSLLLSYTQLHRHTLTLPNTINQIITNQAFSSPLTYFLSNYWDWIDG